MASLSSDRREDVDSGSSLLVFDAPFDTPAGKACPELCESMAAGSRDVLSVLLTGSPEMHFRALHRSVDRRPDRMAIVSVDPGATPATTDSSDVVRRVGTPSDLTKLGVEITKVLSAWDDDGDDADDSDGDDDADGDSDHADIVVCFDSVTPLLQYVDLDRAVRFLQELTNWFDDVGASAHVHVDPEAHGGQTIATLRPLFDDVVERGESHVERGVD